MNKPRILNRGNAKVVTWAIPVLIAAGMMSYGLWRIDPAAFFIVGGLGILLIVVAELYGPSN